MRTPKEVPTVAIDRSAEDLGTLEIERPQEHAATVLINRREEDLRTVEIRRQPEDVPTLEITRRPNDLPATKPSEILAGDAAAAYEEKVARLATGFLALRNEEARRAERDKDRVVELAVTLAERLVGETLEVNPSRIGRLAESVLRQAHDARRVNIDASPADVPALREMLAALGYAAEIHPDPSLGRGSLVFHTDLARFDARLEVQLARLALAMRETLP